MDSKELGWLANVIAELQVPQTHNERQRLTQILQRVAPALIKAIDYTAVAGFSSYNDKDEMVRTGQSCNGCGQDHFFDENNPKHHDLGVKRDGTGGTKCCVEELFQILKEAEDNEDK